MRFPWANTSLLVLIVVQIASGSFGLTNGTEKLRWILWLHGIGAYAIVLLTAWKGAIVFDSLGRRRTMLVARVAFITLAAVLMATLATGIFWTFAGRRLIYLYSLITIHVALAFGVFAILIWHVLHMKFIFRVKRATDRRAFLRLTGIALGGLLLWRLTEGAMDLFGLPGAKRRFTGSYETGSFSSEFPVVTWLFDYPDSVDVANWKLVVDGAVERPIELTYEQLEQLVGDRIIATIDCTGGWYADQEWYGVNVGQVLEMVAVKSTARSVSFVAVSGYGRRFAIGEAKGFLLALGVAGQSLDHSHGFPIRLVAPEHRGFEWVKWLARIEINETSEFLQPPVPLQ